MGPALAPDVLAELEQRGVDAVRMFLAGQGSFKGEGTARDTQYKLGDVNLTRGDVEEWLKWKGATNDRWIKTAAVAAIVAAILAFLSWVFPMN